MANVSPLQLKMREWHGHLRSRHLATTTLFSFWDIATITYEKTGIVISRGSVQSGSFTEQRRSVKSVERFRISILSSWHYEASKLLQFRRPGGGGGGGCWPMRLGSKHLQLASAFTLVQYCVFQCMSSTLPAFPLLQCVAACSLAGDQMTLNSSSPQPPWCIAQQFHSCVRLWMCAARLVFLPSLFWR